MSHIIFPLYEQKRKENCYSLRASCGFRPAVTYKFGDSYLNKNCINSHLSPCNTVACVSGFSEAGDTMEQPSESDWNLEHPLITSMSAGFYLSNSEPAFASYWPRIIQTINPKGHHFKKIHCNVIAYRGATNTHSLPRASILQDNMK